MNPFFLVPLVSGLVCVVCATLILTRDPQSGPHRCIAALLLGTAFWAGCETLWTLAPDADTALGFVKLSAFGWAWVGPLSLHLFLSNELGAGTAWGTALRRALPYTYLVPAFAVAAEWLGDGMHYAVHPVPWGWSYEVGPVYVAWYAFTVVVASAGVASAFVSLGQSDTPAERHQRPWLGASVSFPLLLGSVSDGLLPLLDIQLPRVGTASFAALGVVATTSLVRFGHSLMAPGSWASQILAGLPEGVVLATPGGHVRFANRCAGELLGIHPEELVGRPIADLLPEIPVHPPRVVSELECELIGAEDDVPISLSTTPLHDKQGLLMGLVVVIRDLREVAELRRRLVVSGRLAAVGELAAGIAHEINNPLSFIGANLRMLDEHWARLRESREKGEEIPWEVLTEGHEMIQESIEGVSRAAGIVRDVRVLAHGGSRGREQVDVNAVIEHAVRVARPQLGEGIRLERVLAPVPRIHASAGEIEQVLLNLLMNAQGAIGERGIIRVRSLAPDPGREVEILVEDDGCGIAPEVLERIFDPFFTTKPVGEGTGLGLAISHEIVRRHGGALIVESEPGRGTRARVRLPAGLREADRDEEPGNAR